MATLSAILPEISDGRILSGDPTTFTIAISNDLSTFTKKLHKLPVPELPESFIEHTAAFHKLLYRSKNQHRVTKFFQHLDTIKRRLFSKEQFQQFSLVLSNYQKSFRKIKEENTIQGITKESSEQLLSTLRDVSSFCDRFETLCIQTSIYLKAEIVKKYFLPFTMTAFGFVAYFLRIVNIFRDVVKLWIGLLEQFSYCLPGKEGVPPVDTSSAMDIPKKKIDKMIDDSSTSLSKDQPIKLSFLSMPTTSKIEKSLPIQKIMKEQKQETKKQKILPVKKTVNREKVDSIFYSLLSSSGHTPIRKNEPQKQKNEKAK